MQIDISNLSEQKQDIESKGSNLEGIVNEVVYKFSIDLDNLVKQIDEKIRLQELDSLTDSELESYCLKLSSFMYFAATGQESIGLRESIAQAVNKEDYNNNYAIATGTMADKKAEAELKTQSSMLIEMVYDNAEKLMSAKLTYATHLLSSIKRVLNRRIEQMKMNPATTKTSADRIEV